MVLSRLEPAAVFRFFEAISQIPRGSGNEKAVSDYIRQFAAGKGYAARQDEWHNLIVQKPAAPGYEAHPPVILQGHLDMVCEKNAATRHDFLTDPIPLVVEGDMLRARGTTLGMDDGFAVAVCMALLDDPALPHPPLEIVLTADEEAGMTGAENLDTSLLRGRRMLNLDTGHEGTFFAGCAGGVKAAIMYANTWEAPGPFTLARTVRVQGLQGGHSGEDIHRERGNSLRILARLLYALGEAADLRVASLRGGMKLNAIPREAEAVIALRPEDGDKAAAVIAAFTEALRVEYRVADPGLVISCGEAAAPRVLTADCGQRLTTALLLLPNGVLHKSMDVPGLTDASCNIGVTAQTETETILRVMPRGAVVSRIAMIQAQIRAVAACTGGQAVFSNAYGPWEYRPDSPLRESALGVYRALFDKEPLVASVHAGLECGIFGTKMPGLDVVSFGPDMWDIHTPDERVSVASVRRVWDYVLALLKVL